MRKVIGRLSLLLLAMLLLCGTALADAQINQTDTSVKIIEETKDGSTVFRVTKESGVTSGKTYLLLIQSGSSTDGKPAKPTKDNVCYLDWDTSASTSISFLAYPKEIPNGNYTVYMSDYSTSGGGIAKSVGTISVNSNNERYTLGDVNGKDGITPTDALLAAQIAAKTLSNVQDWQTLAADVNKKDGVTPADALLILQKAAFPNKDYSEFMG